MDISTGMGFIGEIYCLGLSVVFGLTSQLSVPLFESTSPSPFIGRETTILLISDYSFHAVCFAQRTNSFHNCCNYFPIEAILMATLFS